MPGLNNEGVYYSETYTNDPLTTVFNQRHITGANGRGARQAHLSAIAGGSMGKDVA